MIDCIGCVWVKFETTTTTKLRRNDETVIGTSELNEENEISSQLNRNEWRFDELKNIHYIYIDVNVYHLDRVCHPHVRGKIRNFKPANIIH